MAAQTNDVGWWMSLLSDTTRYGASLWERYFGAGSAAPSTSGVEITSSGGKISIVVGKMPWLLIGGGVLLLLVVAGMMRGNRRR